MCALAHFYGWTFPQVRAMTMRDINRAVNYRNKVIEEANRGNS